MATAVEWRKGFALQAKADLDARDQLLANPRLPACQHLLFLQMACEKVCKAHLFGRGSDEGDLRRSHAHIGKQLPIIARERMSTRGAGDATWLLPAIRSLARKIELLSPAIDDGGNCPANCEYPWLDAKGRVVVPSEYNFQIELQHDKAGLKLLKIIHSAVAELCG